MQLDDHISYNNPSDDSYCSSELTQTTHIAQAPNSFSLQCYPQYSRFSDIPIACSSSNLNNLNRRCIKNQIHPLYTGFPVYLTTTGRQFLCTAPLEPTSYCCCFTYYFSHEKLFQTIFFTKYKIYYTNNKELKINAGVPCSAYITSEECFLAFNFAVNPAIKKLTVYYHFPDLPPGDHQTVFVFNCRYKNNESLRINQIFLNLFFL